MPIHAGDSPSSSFVSPLRKTALSKCPNKVRRHSPRPTGPHTSKEVFENYPGVFSLDADVEAMAKKLDGERKEVREWAAKKLKTQMLETAHSLDLQWNGRRVNKFSDVRKSWDENQSDANAKTMCEIVFGGFEGTNSAWSMKWEREFLEKHDRHHLKEATKDGDKKIGCYQKQITISKLDRSRTSIKTSRLRFT